MESTEGQDFVKKIGDWEVNLKHIASMQSCGNNIRGKQASFRATSNSEVDGVIRVFLIWTSPEGKVVELSSGLLRFASIKGVALPINVEVNLRKLKFPANFGEVKRDLGDKLGVKISDAKKENNIYKQNYGFRFVLKDKVLDFEKLFGLSHSKDLEPTARRKASQKETKEEDLSSPSTLEVRDVEHSEPF